MSYLSFEVEDKEKFGQEFLEFFAKMLKEKIISVAQVSEYVGQEAPVDSSD